MKHSVESWNMELESFYLVRNIFAVQDFDCGDAVADDADASGHVVAHCKLLAANEGLGDR